MAPIISVPSRPRLMRPERSVRHSPTLTKMNGVETRMAPASMASGTPHRPRLVLSTSALLHPREEIERPEPEAAVQRLARQDGHEDDALQHHHGGIRQVEPALQEAARGADAAQQDR